MTEILLRTQLKKETFLKVIAKTFNTEYEGNIDTSLSFDIISNDNQTWSIQASDTKNVEEDFSLLSTMIDAERILKENEALKEQIEVLKKRPKRDLSKNKKLKKQILKLRKKGLSFDSIAYELNQNGMTNSEGNRLQLQQVRRLYNAALKEIDEAQPKYIFRNQ